MNMFAHTCANRSAPLTASPAMCRPLPARFPRRVREHPFGQTMGHRPQYTGRATHSGALLRGVIYD